jgi:hypothetical protein
MSKSDFNVLGVQFEDKDVVSLNYDRLEYYMNELFSAYESLYTSGLGYDKVFRQNYFQYRCGTMYDFNPRESQVKDVKAFFAHIPMDERLQDAARFFRQALLLYRFAIHAKWHESYRPKFYDVIKKHFYQSYWFIKYHENQTGMVEELMEKTTELRKLCIAELKIQLASEKPTERVPADIEQDPIKDTDFVRQYTGKDSIEMPWVYAPKPVPQSGGGSGRFTW